MAPGSVLFGVFGVKVRSIDAALEEPLGDWLEESGRAL
jgi:hypothetical protein